jgi:oxygen-independent coproporphyrinogen-3 oxidase
MNIPQKPFSIYIHWPYCLSKCPYCDFASCPTRQIDENLLWSGYHRDILSLPEGRPVHSIFFGGGTPSLMSADLCRRLLDLIRLRHPLEKNCEITMEANPDAISAAKMQDFLLSGINRLSIGVQSLISEDLNFLGRRHSKETALIRVMEAKQIFPEISIDLIYARPNQTLTAWKTELEEALSLGLSHYSLYQLSIEPDTPFE